MSGQPKGTKIPTDGFEQSIPLQRQLKRKAREFFSGFSFFMENGLAIVVVLLERLPVQLRFAMTSILPRDHSIFAPDS